MREHHEAEQIAYRAFKMVKMCGTWVVYNSTGQTVGGFTNPWSAITYIDELLAP